MSDASDADAPAAARGKRKYTHTTDEQTQTLLEWLELPGNFSLLTRPSTTASPPQKRARARPKKTDGYRSLALYMNLKTNSQWTEKVARSRYESFMAGYRKVQRQGVSLKPAFQRLDALFQADRRDNRAASPMEPRRTESMGSVSDREPFMLPGRAESYKPEVREAFFTEPSERQASTPPRREVSTPPRERRPSVYESAASTPKSEEESVPKEATTLNEQAMRLESQRLAVRQQELALKQSELVSRQQQSRQTLRAEVLTRLVEAGKSPAEVREYLKIMDAE